MSFTSVEFAIFLPVVFLLYWLVADKHLKFQNLLLLIASYLFYASWDERFLLLLIFSTLLDYFTGLKMSESNSVPQRKMWFWISIIVNLGFLGVFKYYNFFAESFAELMKGFGLNANPAYINIILPVGISFYTFHGLSYVIDIYNNKIKAEKNFVDYAVFVSFFPLLVAGPIERATHLLPQIKVRRTFNRAQAVDGLRQILWGLVKKLIIADNAAIYANKIFNDSIDQSGSNLVMGAVFFAFQIYGDFSGYSDIALGTAKLFGINLLQNFSFPYFSRDIAEFWRRWHISLSSWFKDYLYFPLGGSRGGKWMRIRNTLIIFIVSGFWHGANWTFIVWGALNAMFMIPLMLTNSNRSNLDIVAKGKLLPDLKETGQIILTFTLTVFAWIFFRADNLGHAFQYISGIISPSLFSMPTGYSRWYLLVAIVFFIVEWLGRENKYAIQTLAISWNRPLRLAFYYLLIVLLMVFSAEEQQFIYFQF